MMEDLPEAVRQGLEAARSAAQKRSNRLCIHVGDQIHRVLRLWDGGFALASSDTPPLRGYVDLYDGPRHLSCCLIVASGAEEAGERTYEFKFQIPASESPPVDFEQVESGPRALIPRAF